jgi:TonB family protein
MQRTLLCVTLGLAIVLLLRKPVRRACGAGPALALWWLPLLLAALPWLPALPERWVPAPTLIVLQTHTMAAVQASGSHVPMLPLLWVLGCACCLVRLAWRYARLRQQCRPLPEAIQRAVLHALPGFDPRRLRLHADGPAVLWGTRSLLLLPGDFTSRYGVADQALVLQHEAMHLRRGDPWGHLIGELVFAALWFHPLAWFALPRLHLDQELACDESVLRRSPQDAAKYARALLNSTGAGVASVLIPWLVEPQLKERLIMIQHHRAGAARRRIGFIGLGVLLAGSVWIAQATGTQVPQQPASADLDYNAHIWPKYPAGAIKNKQQGTVMLKVLVGVDGKPLKIMPEPNTTLAPSLVQAATDTAMKWHFNPARRNGKPIESYALVPVKFSLTPLPPAPPAPPAALPPPPPPAPPVPPAPPAPPQGSATT